MFRHCNAILLRSSLGRNGRTQQQDTHTCAHTASMRVHAAAALSGFWAGTLQRTPLFLRQATSGAESAGAAEMRVNRASLTACAAASLVCPAAHTPTFFCTTEHSRWRCSARRTVRCAPLAVGRHAWPWWPTPPHPRSAGHDACVTVCGGQGILLHAQSARAMWDSSGIRRSAWQTSCCCLLLPPCLSCC